MVKHHELAFILPAKNEEHHIGDVLTTLHGQFPEAFICVVVNGSMDQTASVSRRTLETLSHQPRRYTVITLDEEGKGRAIKKGLSACRAKYYILLDADGQHEPTESHKLWQAARNNGTGMIIGSRYLQNHTDSTNTRTYANTLFNRAIKLFFQTELTDILSGFRLLKDDFAERLTLQSNFFEIEVELFLQARRHKVEIMEVPVREIRSAKANKLNLLKDGLKIFIFTIAKTFKR